MPARPAPERPSFETIVAVDREALAEEACALVLGRIEEALASRGDDYRDYQRRTSLFVPLPPKRS